MKAVRRLLDIVAIAALSGLACCGSGFIAPHDTDYLVAPARAVAREVLVYVAKVPTDVLMNHVPFTLSTSK